MKIVKYFFIITIIVITMSGCGGCSNPSAGQDYNEIRNLNSGPEINPERSWIEYEIDQAG